MKDLESMKLQQGNMSITEYIAKFEELCKFSIIYQRNLDENWKCIKFEVGLREDIMVSVRPMEIHDYATLVDKCYLVEGCNQNWLLQSQKRIRRKMEE